MIVPAKTFNAYGIEKAATEVAGILRALANERRLMILCQLGDAELAARLRAEGIGPVVAVDLPGPAAVRVVKVLAPGLLLSELL